MFRETQRDVLTMWCDSQSVVTRNVLMSSFQILSCWVETTIETSSGRVTWMLSFSLTDFESPGTFIYVGTSNRKNKIRTLPLSRFERKQQTREAVSASGQCARIWWLDRGARKQLTSSSWEESKTTHERTWEKRPIESFSFRSFRLFFLSYR